MIISNGFAAMGISLPGAIAAKLVHPDRKVVALCGDGGFLMNSQELETAKRIGANVTVVIWRDDGYGLIDWKQRNEFGRPFAVEFGNPDFVAYAESFGLAGFRPASADDLYPTLMRALDVPGTGRRRGADRLPREPPADGAAGFADAGRRVAFDVRVRRTGHPSVTRCHLGSRHATSGGRSGPGAGDLSLWRDDAIARDTRVTDRGAAIDDSSRDAHERTTDVAEHRPIPGRVRAARRDGLAEARAGRRPRRPRRPHVDARPVHANRVPVRWPRRLDGVRRHLGVRPRVRHVARARPGRPGTCGALRARGGLGGRRRPRRVGRPGGPDGLLRRPLGVRPRGKRLVAPPERRAETRRALWLVFGGRDRRAAVDQPRLHRGGRPVLRHARVRLRCRPLDGRNP